MSDLSVNPAPAGGELAELLGTLAQHRQFLRHTVRDLTDEQAAQRTTASTLTLGGLIKHVAATERQWASFLTEGAAAMMGGGTAQWADGFQMVEGDTLAGLLDGYEETARRTEALAASLPDLDTAQALPDAPWFPQGLSWTGRRVLLHLIAETAQHSGHADIIRESLDGAKTMA
ncbi:DinB family protein [Rhodococcus sp. X156]|uniref:DinB family protein n=1 Tax=Rhodococcus sp. X156 TaxID=2499145 RepID=UPI000FDAA77E|nr:DinB family protein [Rhodococcus sp. X156]